MKLKLRKIGNSLCVILKREHLGCYNVGEFIDVELPNVITNDVITEVKKDKKPNNVITEKRPLWCEKKHKGRGVYAIKCGCYEDTI